MTRYPYDNPCQRPPYGNPEDWYFNDEFLGVWVNDGDDEELMRRWHTELDLVDSGEWDYERPIHLSDQIRSRIINSLSPPYEKRFERPAQLTVMVVAGVCVAIAIALLRE